MSCSDLERLLERYVNGELADAERERLGAHLDACVACRSLVVAATRPAPEDAALEEAIVAGVMARTTGGACGAAESHLPAFVSAELDASDAELVAMHLSGCASCRQVAEVLTWLPAACREIAFIEPPGAFAAEVSRRSRALRSPRVWPRRLRRAWLGALLRPRFPLELGYVGALVVALLVGPSDAPLRPALAHAARLARTNPVEVVTAGARSGGLIEGVASAGEWVYAGAASRARATYTVLGDTRSHTHELLRAVLAGDVGSVSVQLEEVGGDLERLLEAITRGVTGASSHEHREPAP